METVVECLIKEFVSILSKRLNFLWKVYKLDKLRLLVNLWFRINKEFWLGNSNWLKDVSQHFWLLHSFFERFKIVWINFRILLLISQSSWGFRIHFCLWDTSLRSLSFSLLIKTWIKLNFYLVLLFNLSLNFKLIYFFNSHLSIVILFD